jgi:hypothetical protein
MLSSIQAPAIGVSRLGVREETAVAGALQPSAIP